MNSELPHQTLDILLVEDSLSDIEFTREGLAEANFANTLHVVKDGVAALDFLYHRGDYAKAPEPDLVLLDLNLPRKHGFEVLRDIKADAALKHIPVIVLTTSSAAHDVRKSYDLNANSFISKPVELDHYLAAIRAIKDFWFDLARLPKATVN
jgi:CheY-like chemotaxis protein